MKKSSPVFSLTLLVFSLFTACGRGAPEEEEAENGSTHVEEIDDPGLSGEEDLATTEIDDVNAINNWVNNVLVQVDRDSLSVSDTMQVSRGDQPAEVVIMNEDTPFPVIVVGMPSLDPAEMKETHRYFLRSGEVVLLEETRREAPDSFLVNRFYYDTRGQLLEARTHSGSTPEEGLRATARQYESPYGNADFRLKYNEVRNSAQRYLEGS